MMPDKINNPPPGKSEHLLAEFAPLTYEEWYKTAVQSLKGRPFSKIISSTYEGINLQPIYRVPDTADLPHLDTLPGEFPYLRGTKADGGLNEPWLIAQEIAYSTPEQFNEALRHDLQRGQTAVNLIPDRPTRDGVDPNQAVIDDIGRKGVSLATTADLAAALAGVNLSQTPIFIRSGTAVLPLAALLLAYAQQSGVDMAELRGSLEADPLGELARRGRLPISLSNAFDEITTLISWTRQQAPNLKAITVHSYPYANSGGTAVHELAFTLAAGVEYIRAMQSRDLDIEVIARQMNFAFNLGSDFFMEIAKLRAARLLWAQIVHAFGGSEEAGKMNLHGRTTRFNKSTADAYVNMLRITTEALAGAVAGVDSLHTAPFNEESEPPDEFSRRIARNAQIILQEEANLTQLIDPAGGSWYVEYLTDQIAQRTWRLFQEVERKGGLYEALLAGFPQGLVAATAKKRSTNLARRKDVLVGINMYANPNETPQPVNKTDYTTLAQQRITQIKTYRNQQELEIIANLTTANRQSPISRLQVVNLQSHDCKSSISAAQSGVTLGQLTTALRANYPTNDYPTVRPLPWHRAAEPFEQLRLAADSAPQRPRIFLANMGPLRQHKARADFARRFFKVGGFEIVYPDGFDAPGDAAQAVLAGGAPAVVICGTDDVYPAIIPPLVTKIKKAQPEIIIILAGYPEDQIETYKTAGVDAFIYLGADCYALNRWLQEQMGL